MTAGSGKMIQPPLISVLMPTYNAMPFLPEAVDSIIAQTVTDWHLVIVDDGSTDETSEYLGALHKQLGSQLTTIWWPQNRGIVYALNEGLKVCDGLYIARMDADDISLPNRFEEQLLYLLEHPEIDGCGASIRFFGDETRMMEFPTDPNEVRDLLFERTTVAHPTYFMHRRVYEAFQYSPDYPHAEDLEFLLRVTERFRLSSIPEVLVRYRAGQHQVSVIHSDIQRDSVQRARAEARKRRGHGTT